MKRLATTVFLAVALVGMASIPAAHAQQLLFDYVGFDYESPNSDPLFGGIGDGYRGVGEVPGLFAPLTSDQVNNEYTYYFDGLTAVNRQVVGAFVVIDYAGPGTLTIYEDSRSSGTPADYGTNPPSTVSPATFTDGTGILVGALTNFRYILNLTTGSGSFESVFTVTGGSQFGNLPANQLLGWTFAGTTQNTLSVPAGYDHQVDGQTFLNLPTPARSDTWGGLKRRYR